MHVGHTLEQSAYEMVEPTHPVEGALSWGNLQHKAICATSKNRLCSKQTLRGISAVRRCRLHGPWLATPRHSQMTLSHRRVTGASVYAAYQFTLITEVQMILLTCCSGRGGRAQQRQEGRSGGGGGDQRRAAARGRSLRLAICRAVHHGDAVGAGGRQGRARGGAIIYYPAVTALQCCCGGQVPLHGARHQTQAAVHHGDAVGAGGRRGRMVTRRFRQRNLARSRRRGSLTTLRCGRRRTRCSSAWSGA